MNMTLHQILALVGDLDDSPGIETPRERFRRFLKDNAKDVGQLRDYIQECLTTSGPQYNRALQDLVNYIGSFLEFEVAFGRYAGVQGQNGFDGHWKSPKDFHIVTETKTTDAYAIKTLTLTGYIDALISEKKIPSWDNALGLYVVGRPDADLKQLENAIIAEKRTHQLRVISVESLLSLAEMMTEYDVTHQDILDVLRPSGPRIDPVVDLMARMVAQSQDETLAVSKTPPDEAPQQSKTQPIQATKPNDNIKTDKDAFWLSPVRSEDDETAEECIEQLVGKEHYYAFGERTPGRRNMKEGDHIAFYANTKGVVAHATLSSAPQRKPRPDGSTSEEYPWVCSLKDTHLYLDTPVAIDAKLRLQLDAFQGRNPEKGWAWFVQSTRKVSIHDFDLLTRKMK
jgi:hypothetical protein